MRGAVSSEGIQLKRCIVCSDTKNVSEFGKRSRYPDGRTNSCRECEREYNQKYRDRNRERISHHAERWRTENRDVANARSREWREQFPDRQRAAEINYRKQNPERRRESQEKYKSKPGNIEKERMAQRRWAKKNKDKLAARSAERRALKLRATPPWADMAEIGMIYEEAQRLTIKTGIPHEVDHYYPLKSKIMCGLHCEANLRVVPASINRSKSNKHPDDLMGIFV